MNKFFVNNNRQDSESGKNHEVHREGCFWLSIAKDTTYLGEFFTCTEAVKAAKIKYPFSADGCKHCCPNCHKG